MLLVLLPMPYVEVVLRRRSEEMDALPCCAGIMVELFTAAMALRLAGDRTRLPARGVAFNVMLDGQRVVAVQR